LGQLKKKAIYREVKKRKKDSMIGKKRSYKKQAEPKFQKTQNNSGPMGP